MSSEATKACENCGRKDQLHRPVSEDQLVLCDVCYDQEAGVRWRRLEIRSSRLAVERDKLRREVVALRGHRPHSWHRLRETSPSGKTLFVCSVCDVVSPTPCGGYHDPCPGPSVRSRSREPEELHRTLSLAVVEPGSDKHVTDDTGDCVSWCPACRDHPATACCGREVTNTDRTDPDNPFTYSTTDDRWYCVGCLDSHQVRVWVKSRSVGCNFVVATLPPGHTTDHIIGQVRLLRTGEPRDWQAFATIRIQRPVQCEDDNVFELLLEDAVARVTLHPVED